MTFIKFLSILFSKFKYLIILPLVAAAITFFVTRDLPKQYSSKTTIYTGITSNSGLDVNVTRVDKIITQNEYSNVMSLLKSTSLYEEVGLRLFAQHLSLSKPNEEIISNESYEKLQTQTPPEIKKLVVKNNADKTYDNFRKFLKQSDDNYLYKLLNYNHPFYSINALSNMKPEQVSTSDLFRISYQNKDAGVCYNTLKITAGVFIEKYGEIKRNLKSSAVKYFQTKLDEISAKLNEAENKLLDFNIDNSIINYYEQTKQVTTQHEEIELKLQAMKMSYEASTAVVKKLDGEIAKRFSLNLKNVEILKLRSQLVDCNNSIAQYEIDPETNKNVKGEDLYKKRLTLERKLELCLDSISGIESSTRGVEKQKMLGDWLDAVKDYETYKAMYKSMQDRQAEFMLQFKRYAPLGANIKRIEREIDVYEREYLNVLNNLNIALQNEQNIDIITNMRIIDEPNFPITSLPSKKKLYVIIATLFTLILYVAGLFAIELLDRRIKTPSTLKQLTKLGIAGGFSIQNPKKHPETPLIEAKGLSMIYEHIKQLSDQSDRPFVVQMLSVWDTDVTSVLAGLIKQKLESRAYHVDILNVHEALAEQEQNANEPEILVNYYKMNNFREFTELTSGRPDVIIAVIPSVSRGIDNATLLKTADMSLIVFDANQTWTKACEFYVEKVKQILPEGLYTVLTNAVPANLEEIYGEIPKKRSKIRKQIKALLSRFVN
jgi:uncharacterized protein involved in exopolysaccharide biosynthesis